MQGEVDRKEELQLEVVHLRRRDTTDLQKERRCGLSTRRSETEGEPKTGAHLGVVCIVEILIVEELGSKHYRRYDDSVHIQRREQETISLNETVNIDESEYKTFGAAGSVLIYSAMEIE